MITTKAKFKKMKERAKIFFNRMCSSYYGNSILIINGVKITDPEKIRIVDKKFEQMNISFDKAFQEMDELFEEIL